MRKQTGQQVITIYIFLNISRSQGNQATKFDQLIEFKVRNVFRRKSCRK